MNWKKVRRGPWLTHLVLAKFFVLFDVSIIDQKSSAEAQWSAKRLHFPPVKQCSLFTAIKESIDSAAADERRRRMRGKGKELSINDLLGAD